jgi:hypothetical protein
MGRFTKIGVDSEEGFTLKLMCDICIHAEENYKELEGIRPLQRVEAGFGMPRTPGDTETYYKAMLTGGNTKCRLIGDTPYHCTWNLWITDNWKEDLPKHRLYLSGVGHERASAAVLDGGSLDSYHRYIDEVEAQSTTFAKCKSRIQQKNGLQILYLDCGWLDNKKKLRELKNALKDMGLLLH